MYYACPPDKFRYPQPDKKTPPFIIYFLFIGEPEKERKGGGIGCDTDATFGDFAEYFKKLPRGTRSAKRASHNGETVSRCALITWKAHYRVRLSRSERPSARVDRKIENGTFCPGVAGTAFRCALKSSSLNRPS